MNFIRKHEDITVILEIIQTFLKSDRENIQKPPTHTQTHTTDSQEKARSVDKLIMPKYISLVCPART